MWGNWVYHSNSLHAYPNKFGKDNDHMIKPANLHSVYEFQVDRYYMLKKNHPYHPLVKFCNFDGHVSYFSCKTGIYLLRACLQRISSENIVHVIFSRLQISHLFNFRNMHSQLMSRCFAHTYFVTCVFQVEIVPVI
jgi:hypothetical protein